jgi:Ca2+-binding RTX toxin-like protein
MRGRYLKRPQAQENSKSEKGEVMRRAIMLVVTGALLLTLTAGVALAATYKCIDGSCPGTNERDVIAGDGSDQTFRLMEGNDVGIGKGGADLLLGDGGNDDLYGNRGDDVLRDQGDRGDYDELFGGKGNDVLRADDGDSRDSGSCGAGDDTLYVDSAREAGNFSDCEEEIIV